MLYQCNCGKSFKKPSGLATHRGLGCRSAGEGDSLSTIMHQVAARFDTERAAKRRRMSSPSSSMSVDDAPVASASASNARTSLSGRDLRNNPSPEPEPQQDPPLPSHRTRKIPARFRDFIPSVIAKRVLREALPPPPPSPLPPPPSPPPHRQVRLTLPPWVTEPTRFKVFRRYRKQPSHIPDEDASLEDLLLPTAEPPVSATMASDSNIPRIRQLLNRVVAPFPNFSSFLLMQHHQETTMKTKSDFTRLISTITNPFFKKSEVSKEVFKPQKVWKVLIEDEDTAEGAEEQFPESDGWIHTSVTITVPPLPPTDNTESSPTPTPTPLTIDGLHYRPFIAVCRAAVTHPDALSRFHFEPFEHYWLPNGPNQPPERIFDEVYTSDAMLQEHDRLMKQARELIQENPEIRCHRDRVILGIMIASDSTHLADFGNASAWPVYIFWVNESKYDRSKPSTGAAEHVGFIPKLPDNVQDTIRRATSKTAAKVLLKHCRRELFQAAWATMLDDEFVNAYQHGFVAECSDGKERRFYPRIFTYSADYPEKVLVATIRELGECPCPRCTITKAEISQMGTKADMKKRENRCRIDDDPRRYTVNLARSYIYNEEAPLNVNSMQVEGMLQPLSWTPTNNAFSDKIFTVDPHFNFYQLLVPDFMHEFELGEWKSLLTHLLSLLLGMGQDKLDELDARFRQIPPFGRDTIRPFTSNVSRLKKLAARDFEDILQCMLPAIDGLFPSPYDQQIQQLLFTACEVLSLAKLRMHTGTTVSLLDSAVTSYGSQIRKYERTTCNLPSAELPQIKEKRLRQAAKKQAQQSAADPVNKTASKRKKTSKRKTASTEHQPYNLIRYKLHAMGDWPGSIGWIGTLDNYTTQWSELQHRFVKARYRRSSKNKTAIKQLTQQDRIHRKLKLIQRRVRLVLGSPTKKSPLPWILPKDRFQMAIQPRKHQNATTFAQGPGLPHASFISDLKDFILTHLRPGPPSETSTANPVFSDEERINVVLKHNRLYQHSHARFNYTTYDIRRAQDSISMRTARCDVMVAACDESAGDHPFHYARVLGVFHTFAKDLSSPDAESRRVDLLWVRWFALDSSRLGTGSFKHLRQDRVTLMSGEGAYGFIHPSDVIRACHIVPAFRFGVLHSTGPPEWRYYYVNRFVDRDMYMRYRGCGVGHLDPKVRAMYDTLDAYTIEDEDEVIEEDDPAARAGPSEAEAATHGDSASGTDDSSSESSDDVSDNELEPSSEGSGESDLGDGDEASEEFDPEAMEAEEEDASDSGSVDVNYDQ